MKGARELMKGAREIVRSATLALLVAAFIAAPVQAEPAFSPPHTLLTGWVGTPRIAVDSQGSATVIALESTGTAEGTLIHAFRMSPAGLPQPAHILAAIPPVSPLGRCICLQIAIDPFDRAVVTWQTVVDGERRIAAVLIASNGEPQPAKIVSPLGADASHPRVVANDEGVFALAWEVSGEEGRIEASLIGADGTFAEPHLINEPADGGAYPYLAAAPDGSFRVAWEQQARIRTTRLDEEGNPGTIQPVSPEGETAFLSGIVVDSEGRTTISWWHAAGAYEAKVVRLGADGSPGTIWTLQPPGQNVGSPEIAIDGQDRVTAVWEVFESGIFAVRLGADGVPEDPHRVSPEGHLAGGPQLAAAPDGRVVVGWAHPARFAIPEEACGVTELEPEDDVIRAAFLGSDGTLNGVYDVSAHGEEAVGPWVALDPLGLPQFAWETYDGTYFCEEVSGRVQFSHGFETQAPSGESPVAPPAPAPQDVSPTLLLAKRGVAERGRVRLKASCAGQSAGVCAGSIRLLSSKAALLPAGARSSTQRKQTLPLAAGRYNVAEGSAVTLELSIPKATRRLIAARNPSRLTAIVTGHGLPVKKVLIRVVGPKP